MVTPTTGVSGDGGGTLTLRGWGVVTKTSEVPHA